jgi:hypothetical protein
MTRRVCVAGHDAYFETELSKKAAGEDSREAKSLAGPAYS